MNSANIEIERCFWQYDVDGELHRMRRLMAVFQCAYLRLMINHQRPLVKAQECGVVTA